MIRTAARVLGAVYLLVGILGFIPGLTTPMAATTMGGMSLLLGLFPVNLLHNIVHIVVGLAGLIVGGSFANSRSYFRTLAVVFGLLTILGLIPATTNVFGLVPLGSWDIGLHLVTTAVAVYFGWMSLPSEQEKSRAA